MKSKRELVTRVLHGEDAGTIPVGLWHHFMEYKDMNSALTDPAVFAKNLAGQRAYKEAYQPDFVKIMTDGLFFLPYSYAGFRQAKDFKNLQVVDSRNEWIRKNVELVRQVRALYGEDILILFNVFPPYQHIRDAIRFEQDIPMSVDKMPVFLSQDRDVMAAAMEVMAEGLCNLIREVVQPGRADGIYLALTDWFESIPLELYKECICPAERKIMDFANTLSDCNVVHLCGNFGSNVRRFFEMYNEYGACAVNWAIGQTKITMEEGRRLFPGKTLIGGFDNSPKGVLMTGSKEEVQAQTERILQTAGRTGLILGADCTIPAVFDTQRLAWIREAAAGRN